MTDLNALKQANATRWVRAKLTRNFTSVAVHLVAPAAKARYQAVSQMLAARGFVVPWFFTAVAHEREASQDWNTHLAQGDPLHEITRHVPAGEPAFATWEEGAVDALLNCPPHAARNTDWSIGGTLTMLEQYNGLGYASGPYDSETKIMYPPQSSPYIWSGTDQYKSGKYVRDRVFKPNVVDVQLGCAGLLMAMMALDPTITFTGAKITITPSAPKPVAPSVPSVTNPAPGSIGAFIASILSAIFKRR